MGTASLDRTDHEILRALRDDARTSYAELGRRVGLSAPATAERVRRLEERGAIRGYHAALDAAALGQPIAAFVRVAAATDRYPAIRALAAHRPEVLECHHVSGEDAFLLRVSVRSVGHLEDLLQALGRHGRTSTAIVLSTPVAKGLPVPEDAE